MMSAPNPIPIPEPVEIPAGFSFGTASAGIKYQGRQDIGVLICTKSASCAGVFTQNLFTAAPVTVSKQVLQNSAGRVGGVIVNSGCANAATGDIGKTNAQDMAVEGAAAVNAIAPFLVCSTGTIGVQLPMNKIRQTLPSLREGLGSTKEDFARFSESILTTDTVRKLASQKFAMHGKEVTIAGCAKGSGMMQPNMATMLSYVITDAEIGHELLQRLFAGVVARTLNCVTIDGDTSTNDTALCFASGASGIKIDAGSELEKLFVAALDQVLQSLARQLARDGEGATKLLEIEVRGARTFHDARKAALAVGNSPLVKTAIYGRDANWGRIACALGYSGVEFDASLTDISIGDLDLMREGAPLLFSEERALELLSADKVEIFANLNVGKAYARVFTCDLTEKYIEINGSYRT